MSDAAKDLAEVPRQFVKEGTQVSDLVDIHYDEATADLPLLPYSSSIGAPSPPKRVSFNGFVE